MASPDASSDRPARAWDASTYHSVSGPLEEMGRKVLDRLPLRGDERVLDAGCGTGRVTALLLERLPRGLIVAVDADQSMVDKAAESLGSDERVSVRVGDLLRLDVDAGFDEAFDAVISTATFHWILDHDRLFANLFRALKPGGLLVAQCGGAGNIAKVLGAADAVAADPRWAARFKGWVRPSQMATAEETAARLVASGFTEVNCWLAPAPVVPDDPIAYLATVNLGAHIQRLDGRDRDDFVAAVAHRLGEPITIDYIRLNIDAEKPRA